MTILTARLARVRRAISQRLRRRFLNHYRAAVSDISLRLQDLATLETAAYVRDKMPLVQPVGSWRQVHDIAIPHARLEEGMVLEFGVFSGATVNYLAARTGWQIDAFDSFEGLPETWRGGYPKGTFARGTLPKVAPNVSLHVGWFADRLPPFLAADSRPVRYLHVDSDLYSSARTIFIHLRNRILPGTVIVFDEYFNYDGWLQGEFHAFQEFVADTNLGYEYLTYNHRHQQVAVRIL